MSDQRAEPFDVFLSHPHSEADAVESIGDKLEDEAGLRVWLDRWIPPFLLAFAAYTIASCSRNVLARSDLQVRLSGLMEITSTSLIP